MRYNAQGKPAVYVAVSGDSLTGLETRFGAVWWQLNCYRRSDPGDIWVGDVINLDPYTVKTVGTEEGKYMPPNAASQASCLAQTAMPPQR